MDKIPILCDTEQDDEEEIHKKVNSKAAVQNATNTLFNITFDNGDQKYESIEFKNYENKLHQDMKDWKSLYQNAYECLKQSKQKHPVVDKSILPPEKVKYLEKAENLQNFIRESVEFRQQATLFLEYDYAEFIEMLQNLEMLYDHSLTLIKTNKLAENLANINKNFK